ncbi:unnamed protein product [Gongylonema pulchrum]|uniref:Ovule protein n=1 Tax=Gongylonema pulchrum TaxID=637853 RepID=A0A183ERY6_9BILA|nr:unnamed protein product [Gongylonema pulchrum]
MRHVAGSEISLQYRRRHILQLQTKRTMEPKKKMQRAIKHSKNARFRQTYTVEELQFGLQLVLQLLTALYLCEISADSLQ